MDDEGGTFRATLPHGAVGGPRAQASRVRRRETALRAGLAAIGILALMSVTIVLAGPSGGGSAARPSADPIERNSAAPLAPRTATGGTAAGAAPTPGGLAGAGDLLTPPALPGDAKAVRVNGGRSAAPAGAKRVVSVEPRKRVVVAPAPATAGESTVALGSAGPAAGGTPAGGTAGDTGTLAGSGVPEPAPTAPPTEATDAVTPGAGIQVVPGGPATAGPTPAGRGSGALAGALPGAGGALAAVAGVFPQAAALIEGRVTAGVPFTLRRPGTEQALLVAPTAAAGADASGVVPLEVVPTGPGESQVSVPEGEAPGPYLLVTLTGGGAPTGLQLVQVDAAPPAAAATVAPVPAGALPPTPPASLAAPPAPALPAPTPPTPPTPASSPSSTTTSPAATTSSAATVPATAAPAPPLEAAMATLAAGSVRMEAEGGDMDGSMVAATLDGASGGRAVGVPEGNPEEGTSRLVLDVPVDGTYVLSGRVLAPDDESNSFFVAVDGGSETLWKMPSGPSWTWHGVKTEEANEPFAYFLRAGQHRIDVRAREDGTLLDAVVLTPRGSTPPS